MQGGPGIPNSYWYGEEGGYNILVMELLGLSLDDLLKTCKKFDVATVVSIADQMLTSIEYFHNNSYLHRDIKPNNFVVGMDKTVIYIIDYGLSKKYRNAKSFIHISYRDRKEIVGTVRYSSLNTHLGIEQSRRDDLECLGYTLIYLVKGELPWQKPTGKTRLQKFAEVKRQKELLSVDELCKGLDPEFSKYLSYCKGLKFEQKPDYSYLRKLFKTSLYHQSDNANVVYEWVKFGLSKKVEMSGEYTEGVTNEALGGTRQLSESNISITQKSADFNINRKQESVIAKSLFNKDKESRKRSVDSIRNDVQAFEGIVKNSETKREKTSLELINNLFNIKQKHFKDIYKKKKNSVELEEFLYNYNKEELLNYDESLSDRNKVALDYFIKEQNFMQTTLNASTSQKSTDGFKVKIEDDSGKGIIIQDIIKKKGETNNYKEMAKNSDYIGFKRTKKPIIKLNEKPSKEILEDLLGD